MSPGIPLSFSWGMKGGGIVLLPLTLGDVSANGFSADMAGGADVISAGPELVSPGLFCQRRERLAYNLGTVALEQSDDLRWRIFRRSTDEAMDMIDIRFEGKQLEAVRGTALLDRSFDHHLNFVREDLSSILRNPYEMIGDLIVTPTGFTGLQGIHDSASISA